MTDNLPSPGSDPARYERPSDAWVCGHACDGKPCRMGPTTGGVCRATADCRPVLDKLPGEEKGSWRCTRAKEHGGPCADGPRPDGSCGCPALVCAPQRTLRNLRGRTTLVVVAVTVACLLIGLGSGWRWRILSPRPVSRPHQGDSFARVAKERLDAPNSCAACHGAAASDIASWAQMALRSHPAPFGKDQFAKVPDGVVPMSAMDQQSCAVCHDQHEFHQPNVVQGHSCSVCHVEHQGLAMVAPEDVQCAHCHDHADVMQQSSAKGRGIGSERFDPPVQAGLIAFRTPRPPGGRTNLIASFGQGHPDFGVRAGGLKDPDTLKFNHALHLSGTVRLGGNPLGCVDCHVPDATGSYMARIRYDQHCAACHDLQFDPVHPELKLPHGEVAAVRAKLRGLPLLYAEIKTKELVAAGSPPRRDEVDAFAQQNVARMRQTFGGGESLEKLVFFTGDPRQAQPGISAERRAHYAGCAYCHEVLPDTASLAKVTRPVIPDRWLLGGRFTHAKHGQMSCDGCHAVHDSRTTSDINLPSQASCAGCHKPGGSARSECTSCHTYHLLRSR